MYVQDKDIERFMEKVDVRDRYECWDWQASLRKQGYGQFMLNGSNELAHRVSYLIEHGTLPELIDHKCRNRKCVNPKHLRPATAKENTRNSRKSLRNFCPQGHLFDKENTYESKQGRTCRTCNRERARERRKKEGVLSQEDRKAATANRTECKNGHEYTEDNTYVASEGYKVCKTCTREAGERHRRKNGAKPASEKKTHCKHGHEYTKENTRMNNRGHRECRACLQIRSERGR